MNDWHDAEHQVERAHELYELGRWAEAEKALREAIAVNPYQPEWHFNLGLTLSAAGRLPQAVEAFEAAHELSDPSSTQAALELSAALMDLHRPAEARAWLELALTRDDHCAEAHVQLIDVCALLGQHDEAEVHFYMAVQLQPENASAYSTMAESLLDRRQFDRAAWCLREAARLDSTLTRVNARLAYTYAQTGRLERARQLYLRELRTNPGDVDTIVELGRLLMEMNRTDEAGEKLRRALEIEPSQIEAHTALGELAERLGQVEASLRHYDVVVRLDPVYPGARRRLAWALLEHSGRGEHQRARVLLREDLGLLLDHPEARSADDVDELVGLLLDAGLPEEATRAAGMLIADRPNDPAAHHRLSVALLMSGRVVAGMESARRALRLRRDFLAPMHNLAVAHLRRGEISRARYWVAQGLGQEPENREFRRLRVLLRVRAVGSALESVGLAFRRSRPRR
jgi:tetratricopeptide (TPR) repeat protein